MNDIDLLIMTEIYLLNVFREVENIDSSLKKTEIE